MGRRRSRGRGQYHVRDHDKYERRATSDAVGQQYDRHRNERPESDDGRNVADSRIFDAESALDLRQGKHHDGGAVARDE